MTRGHINILKQQVANVMIVIRKKNDGTTKLSLAAKRNDNLMI